MDITKAIYPDFVANQVLTSTHLNTMRDYLDEQNRLTRANLIGIGIACGLEVSLDAGPGTTIRLSKGVGVTSQGYLIAEPSDVTFGSARKYVTPPDPGYPPFERHTTNIWELLARREDGDTPLGEIEGLADKVVVLFVDLKRTTAQVCSPVDCDDKGTLVNAAHRRLLINRSELDNLMADAGDTKPSPLGETMGLLLGLTDIRMPRYDTPANNLISTEAVLGAFQTPFFEDGLVDATGEALQALYTVLRPLVSDRYPTDPFASFATDFGFLRDNPPVSQVLFMQNHRGFFDDILSAYQETRRRSLDLLCLCNPPTDLFPRHLMAGALDGTAGHHHGFARSPAVDQCVDQTKEVVALFVRLVRMVETFTKEPPIGEIRITPSRTRAALSDRAIPYYYAPAGTPPLHEVWRSARSQRTEPVLGYHAGVRNPQPPQFVTEPLRFGLEPNDFLRIEGHLGQPLDSALKSILDLRMTYRLPFSVVALRTGVIPEDYQPKLDDCPYPDLRTMYEILRTELECFVSDRMRALYSVSTETVDKPAAPRSLAEGRAAVEPEVRPGTLGVMLQRHRKVVEQLAPDLVAARAFISTQGAGTEENFVYLASGYLNALAGLQDALGPDMRQVDLNRVEERVEAAELFYDTIRENPELSKHLGGLVDDQRGAVAAECGLDKFRALREECARRIISMLKATTFTEFTKQHPGIQHGAGVPVGGTFIIVHHAPTESRAPDDSYGIAASQMEEETVIADFFLPYVCCSGEAPVQFTLPDPRLDVQVTLGCTGPDGITEATITGAVGPLTVWVDGGQPQPVEGTLPLGQGEHTIVVRDATRATSNPVAVAVPPPLELVDVGHISDPGGEFHQLDFTITGGTPPYSDERGDLYGEDTQSKRVRLSDPIEVFVVDAAGCELQRSFSPPDPDCDLPCGGAAVRWGYRFWLPKPPARIPIQKYYVDISGFWVYTEHKQFDLTAQVGEILAKAPNEMMRTNFDSMVADWMKAINQVIAAEFGSDQWLRLEYVPPEADQSTGALFVDRLECIDFEFSLTVTYVLGETEQKWSHTYLSEGTLVVGSHVPDEVFVPLFSGSASNKCRPDQRPKPICEETDLKPIIRYEVDRSGALVLSAEIAGDGQASAFLWEVQHGYPALSSEQQFLVRFNTVVPVEKRIHLTVFSEHGCAVSVDELINIRGPVR